MLLGSHCSLIANRGVPFTPRPMTINRLVSIAALAAALISAASAQTVITLQNATAQVSQSGFGVSAAIDGSITNDIGWAHGGLNTADDAVFETATDASFGTYNFTFTMNYSDHTLGRFRLSTTADDRSTFADGLQNGGDVTATWTVLTPFNLVSSGGATMSVLGDNSILVGGTSPTADTYTFSANSNQLAVTGFRIELLLDASLPGTGPGRAGNSNFVLSEFAITGVGAVPEPSTYALFAGVLALGLATWHRRR